MTGFSDEQKQYLQGFVAGTDAARAFLQLPTFAAAVAANFPATSKETAVDLADSHRRAQDRVIARGEKLSAEEQAKRDKDPFGIWDEMRNNAAAGRFPKGTDVFLYKSHGMFYVAPAQNSLMCRLRFPGGIVSAAQMRGVADIAEQWGGGFTDVTTRANLQIREIGAANAIEVVNGLIDLGIVNRGSGGDNVRNVTGSPTAGIDPQELIDTRPLCREMHHYILQSRELYGLPRKFNIAFDGGGRISAVADTNDIGFVAIRVDDDQELPAGVYFRVELGGITGHLDFARDTGWMLRPSECVPVAAAILRVFIAHGDRTDRKKARLKYVLDSLGFEPFLQLVEKELGRPLYRGSKATAKSESSPATNFASEDRLGHVGFHPQKQPDRHYVGVVLPVGRLTCSQMRTLAGIAERYGSGTIRLTVWQNLLISDIATHSIPQIKQELEACGLQWSATNVRAGLIACTGSGGCRFAAGNTKQHAMQIAEYLEPRIALDQPLNIHLTGCHHSCAQHYIGDIGLLATKVAVGDDLVDGYHMFVGGGYGSDQRIARCLLRDVRMSDVPAKILRLIQNYHFNRLSTRETFREYSRRLVAEDLVAETELCHSVTEQET